MLHKREKNLFLRNGDDFSSSAGFGRQSHHLPADGEARAPIEIQGVGIVFDGGQHIDGRSGLAVDLFDHKVGTNTERLQIALHLCFKSMQPVGIAGKANALIRCRGFGDNRSRIGFQGGCRRRHPQGTQKAKPGSSACLRQP